MTEEEMKTKECPQHLMMMVMMQIAAGKQGASEEEIVGMGSFGFCSGSKCAMWESEYEEEYKEIPGDEGVPEGWFLKQGIFNQKKKIARHVKIASGDCGLKSKENGCFYPG